MRGLWRIFRRSASWEWRFITRQPLERVMLLWLPLLTVSLMWYIFSAAQLNNLSIGVLDKDNSSLSRKLITIVNASPNVEIVARYRNGQEMKQALLKTDVYATLIIPKDFAHNLRQVKPSPVTLVVDGQYGTHSGIIQTAMNRAVRTFSAGAELYFRKKMGMTEEQAREALNPIFPDSKMAFNITLNYQQFLATTIIPALLHILATMTGVGVVGRELRDKSLGKWFWAVSRAESEHTPHFFALLSALMGKVLWCSLIFCLWMVVTLLLVASSEHPPLANLVVTVLGACSFMLLSVWIGVVLTSVVMSKRLGLSNAGIVTAPAFAFSGVTYPLVAMPKAAQLIASALPLTYYLHLQIAQIQTHQAWHLGLPTVFGLMLAVLIMMLTATLFTLIALKRKHRWGMR